MDIIVSKALNILNDIAIKLFICNKNFFFLSYYDEFCLPNNIIIFLLPTKLLYLIKKQDEIMVREFSQIIEFWKFKIVLGRPKIFLSTH